MKGRYIVVWASGAFLDYAAEQKIKPQELGSAALHTLAIEAPRELVIVDLAPSALGLCRRFIRGGSHDLAA